MRIQSSGVAPAPTDMGSSPAAGE